MSQISIKGLPEYLFAHIYGAEQYNNTLIPRSNLIEIGYLAYGQLATAYNGQTLNAEPGDLFCNLYLHPFSIHTDHKHEHHTVCFVTPFSIVEEGGYWLPAVLSAGEEGARMRTLIDDIIRQSILSPNRRLTCAGLFLELIDRIDEFSRKEVAPVRHSDLTYAKRAKRYIFDNLTKKITQHEIADELGITAGYLCSVFKNAEGIPLMRFINRTKLEKIRTVMEKDKLKLYQASEMYGYSDPNYVSHLYKKYFGESILESICDGKQAVVKNF